MKNDLLQVKNGNKHAELLTTEEVAQLLKVAPATLVDWRHNQAGPPYHKKDRIVRYWRHEVLEWIGQAFTRVEPTTV